MTTSSPTARLFLISAGSVETATAPQPVRRLRLARLWPASRTTGSPAPRSGIRGR